MGGFHGWDKSLYPVSRLNDESYPEMLKRDAPPDPTAPPTRASDFRILVTESEILDKSKGDRLGKLLTVLQTTWFIAQYLERWAAHLPRTQLEVMTLAYAALNILIYALWWRKPLNIEEPIDVNGRASAVVDGRTKGLHGVLQVLGGALRLPHLEDGATWDDQFFFSGVFPVVGILFGGVHCLAWRFPFPTGQEKVIWRVCAVYCTASPFFLPIVYFLGGAPYNRFPRWVNNIFVALSNLLQMLDGLLRFSASLRRLGRVANNIVASSFPLILYVVCRIILIVLTFTSLRAPPAGVYETTSWIHFLPHFG